MAATEVSIRGQFESDLYEKVVERLSASAHKADAFDCEETFFQRGQFRSPSRTSLDFLSSSLTFDEEDFDSTNLSKLDLT
jgi:hypothetical protein